MTTEFKRLGKRGAYRFGQLQTRGIPGQQAPVPFQPRFARHYRRRPNWARALGLVAGFLLIAGGAVAGWWFLRLVVGSCDWAAAGSRAYIWGLAANVFAAVWIWATYSRQVRSSMLR